MGLTERVPTSLWSPRFREPIRNLVLRGFCLNATLADAHRAVTTCTRATTQPRALKAAYAPHVSAQTRPSLLVLPDAGQHPPLL